MYAADVWQICPRSVTNVIFLFSLAVIWNANSFRSIMTNRECFNIGNLQDGTFAAKKFPECNRLCIFVRGERILFQILCVVNTGRVVFPCKYFQSSNMVSMIVSYKNTHNCLHGKMTVHILREPAEWRLLRFPHQLIYHGNSLPI